MMKHRTGKAWIPLWIDKRLFGSTRHELILRPPEEAAARYGGFLDLRGVFDDLMALAGKDNGYVRVNAGMAYPDEQLAGLLYVPLEVLRLTIETALKFGKLERLLDGTLRFTSWEEYQLSPRWMRSFDSPETSLPFEEGVPQIRKPIPPKRNAKERKEENKRKENRKGDAPPIPSAIYDAIVAEFAREPEIELRIDYGALRRLIAEFPDLDHLEEIKKKMTWWLDNPPHKHSRINLQLRNWFVKAQEFLEKMRREARSGAAGESTRRTDPHRSLKELYHRDLEAELEKKIDEVKQDPYLITVARNEANEKMQKFIRALAAGERWALDWRPR
jgi:hypothetical protein